MRCCRCRKFGDSISFQRGSFPSSAVDTLPAGFVMLSTYYQPYSFPTLHSQRHMCLTHVHSLSTNRTSHPVLRYGRKSFLLADGQHVTVQPLSPHLPGGAHPFHLSPPPQKAILPHTHDHTFLMICMAQLSVPAEVPVVEPLSIRQVLNLTNSKDSSHAKLTNGEMRFGVVRTHVDCAVVAVLALVGAGMPATLNTIC